MECIYLPELKTDTKKFLIDDEESRHLRALRIETGDAILATNGKGLMARISIERTGKKEYFGFTELFFPNKNEKKSRIGLALGILDDKARFEFAFEKAVELGVSDFYPVIAERSQKQDISKERLESKAIAALKQCKRSTLPVIHEPININDLIESTSKYFDKHIICDENGVYPEFKNEVENTLLYIGPEGGFTKNEIDRIKLIDAKSWNLGVTRLRGETAAVVAMGICSAFLK